MCHSYRGSRYFHCYNNPLRLDPVVGIVSTLILERRNGCIQRTQQLSEYSLQLLVYSSRLDPIRRLDLEKYINSSELTLQLNLLNVPIGHVQQKKN